MLTRSDSEIAVFHLTIGTAGPPGGVLTLRATTTST